MADYELWGRSASTLAKCIRRLNIYLPCFNSNLGKHRGFLDLVAFGTITLPYAADVRIHMAADPPCIKDLADFLQDLLVETNNTSNGHLVVNKPNRLPDQQ